MNEFGDEQAPGQAYQAPAYQAPGYYAPATGQPPPYQVASHQAPAAAYPPPAHPPLAGYGPPPTASPKSKSSTLALLALVAGCLSFFVPFLAAVVAVVLGLVAVVRIKISGGTKTGIPMAVVGMALGLLSSVVFAWLLSREAFREGFLAGVAESYAEAYPDPGDCVNMPVDESGNYSPHLAQVVPCSEPHTAEYFGGGILPASEYPGDNATWTMSAERCEQVFLSYAGYSIWSADDLDYIVSYPLELDWRLQDRSFGCYATALDGSPRTGSILD